MNKNIQYIVENFLLEGQVDGLKNVKIIRHYTTGDALKNILKTGIIMPNESEGDVDWKAYDLFDKNVISFHDKRTDPEYNTFIKHNNRKISIDGCTPTLALHAKKVCCCIEIDYDMLDEQIKDNTHLLNIYRKKAEEFINVWNYIFDSNDNDKMYKYRITKVKLCDLGIKAYNNTELLNSLKLIWKRYISESDLKNPDALLAISEIKKIYQDIYTNENINRIIKTYFGDKKFWIDDYTSQIGFGFNYGFPSLKNFKEVKAKYLRSAEFYKRNNYKKIPEDKINDFANIVAKFDVIGAIKFLKSYGWKFGDSEFDEFIGGRVHISDNTYGDMSIIRWLDALSKNKNRIIDANIEIRIPFPVKLTKDNSRIKIFTGIAEATDQLYLLKLPKKYNKLYNIEYIEPK